MNIVDLARRFAEKAHATQKRKYTFEPYFVHLDEVAKLCARHGLAKRSIAAAYLHDVAEDFEYTGVTIYEVHQKFGSEIGVIVGELTDEPKRDGISRKERKLLDIARLEGASGSAQSIKCADLISNTSSIVRHDVHFARTYLPEKRACLTVLTRANPKLLQIAWERLVEAEKAIA